MGLLLYMELKNVSYTIIGTVEHGFAEARNSGYPTANLTTKESLDIPEGIYCGWTRVGDGERLPGIIFYGIPHSLSVVTKPRFEVHLLEGGQELYDKELAVELTAFVRENKKFKDATRLQNAIEEDIEMAREYFKLSSRAQSRDPDDERDSSLHSE